MVLALALRSGAVPVTFVRAGGDGVPLCSIPYLAFAAGVRIRHSLAVLFAVFAEYGPAFGYYESVIH